VTNTELLRLRILLNSDSPGYPMGSQWARELLVQYKAGQWIDIFELMRRNRMEMGFHRYGPLELQGLINRAYDNVGSISDRCAAYKDDANLEHMIDIANLAMIEFVQGLARGQRVVATDDALHAKEK